MIVCLFFKFTSSIWSCILSIYFSQGTKKKKEFFPSEHAELSKMAKHFFSAILQNFSDVAYSFSHIGVFGRRNSSSK